MLVESFRIRASVASLGYEVEGGGGAESPPRWARSGENPGGARVNCQTLISGLAVCIFVCEQFMNSVRLFVHLIVY